MQFKVGQIVKTKDSVFPALFRSRLCKIVEITDDWLPYTVVFLDDGFTSRCSKSCLEYSPLYVFLEELCIK